MSYIVKTKFGNKITVETKNELQNLLRDSVINLNSSVYDTVFNMDMVVSDILSQDMAGSGDYNRLNYNERNTFVNKRGRTGTFVAASVILLFDLLLLLFSVFYAVGNEGKITIGDISIPLIWTYIFSVSVLIVFLIVFFKSGSINVKANGMLILSLFMFVLFAGQGAIEMDTIIKKRTQENAAYAYLDKLIKDMLQDKKPQPGEFDKETYGDYSEMLKVINQAYNDFYNNRTEYLDLCKKLGTNFNNNTAAKENIKDILLYLDNYEVKYDSFLLKYKEFIENSNMEKRKKNAMLEGYNKSIEENKAFLKEYFDIERKAFNAFDKIIQFRIDHNAEYSEIEDSVIFNTQEEVDEYNKLQREADEYLKKEDEWFKKRESRANELIGRAKQLN